jgi:hypothetical protein
MDPAREEHLTTKRYAMRLPKVFAEERGQRKVELNGVASVGNKSAQNRDVGSVSPFAASLVLYGSIIAHGLSLNGLSNTKKLLLLKHGGDRDQGVIWRCGFRLLQLSKIISSSRSLVI